MSISSLVSQQCPSGLFSFQSNLHEPSVLSYTTQRWSDFDLLEICLAWSRRDGIAGAQLSEAQSLKAFKRWNYGFIALPQTPEWSWFFNLSLKINIWSIFYETHTHTHSHFRVLQRYPGSLINNTGRWATICLRTENRFYWVQSGIKTSPCHLKITFYVFSN